MKESLAFDFRLKIIIPSLMDLSNFLKAFSFSVILYSAPWKSFSSSENNTKKGKRNNNSIISKLLCAIIHQSNHHVKLFTKMTFKKKVIFFIIIMMIIETTRHKTKRKETKNVSELRMMRKKSHAISSWRFEWREKGWKMKNNNGWKNGRK
jgi:hypothetical protein